MYRYEIRIVLILKRKGLLVKSVGTSTVVGTTLTCCNGCDSFNRQRVSYPMTTNPCTLTSETSWLGV